MILSPFVDGQKRMRYYVLNFEGWDQFEQLVRYVERSVDGTVTEQVDGPDARVWTVTVENCAIVITHDHWLGNGFYTEGENAARVLQDVIRAVEAAEL